MPVGGGGADVAIGDVDSDGDLDLAFGDWQGRLYVNDGAGTYTDVTATHLPIGSSSELELGDIDDDGDLDLVFIPYGGSGSLQLYLNDGSGIYADASAARLPSNNGFSSSLALGDVDRDGDLDLLAANLDNRLYLNLLRQLDAPLRLAIGHVYRFDIYARYGPPGTTDFAVPAIAHATAHLPLPPFGTLGIDPATTVVLPLVAVAQPAGIGMFSFTVPNDPGLQGLPVHAQALLIQAPLQARLTNVTSDAVGL